MSHTVLVVDNSGSMRNDDVYDEESRGFYFSNGTETTWDMPPHAVPQPLEPPEWWSGNEGAWRDRARCLRTRSAMLHPCHSYPRVCAVS